MRVVAENERRQATRERDRARHEHLVADEQRDAAAKSSSDAMAHAREADIQRKRAEARGADLVELANRSLLEVQTMLERVPGALEARKAVIDSTLKYLDNLRATSGDDPEVLAALVTGYTSTGDVLGLPLRPNLGDRAGAVRAYATARALLARLTKMKPAGLRVRLQTIGLYQRSGVVFESEGNVEQALREYRGGLGVAEELAHDFPSVAHAVAQVGIMEHQLSLTMTSRDTAQAEEHARREIAAYERAVAMDPKEGNEGLTGAHASLARVLTAEERPREAAAEFKVALARAEGRVAFNPSDGIALGAVANFCLRLAVLNGAPWQPSLSDRASALAFSERSLAIYRRLADADKGNRKGAFDLAEALAYSGAIGNSAEKLQSAIVTLERLLQTNPRQVHAHVDLAFAHEYLGRVKFAGGDTKGALEEYRKSLDTVRMITELSPADSVAWMQAVATREAMSEALASGGERDKSLQAAREAAELVRKTTVPLPPRLKPVTLAWVGDTFRDASDVAAACAAWREAEAAKLATCR